jgi:branched-chain amino acid transport system ATP-binding protein
MSTILQLTNVTKHFGYPVIDDVTLSIIRGERHALIGPNGAGKSTLFNLITGRYRVTKGHISFKDKRIDHLAPHKIVRLGIARSFQIINIFKDRTVFHNMRTAVVARHRREHACSCLLGGMNEIAKETESWLARLNLLSYRDETAGTLGYGQQRALEIGLTMALEPEVVLLDEPGAGLSPQDTKEVVKVIREITVGKTLLIIEHDMDVIFDLADRISVLNRGKLLACSAPDEIKANEAVKEAYLGRLFDE